MMMMMMMMMMTVYNNNQNTHFFGRNTHIHTYNKVTLPLHTLAIYTNKDRKTPSSQKTQ